MIRRLVLAIALSLVLPGVVRADTFLVPFLGAAFSGTVSDVDLAETGHRPTAWGASIGSMGKGVLGFEAEIAFAPDFFGDSDSTLFGASSLTTVTGNVLFGMPIGGQSGAGFRPYFAAGAGLIRSRIDGFGQILEFSANNFGYDIGGGAFIFLGSSFGVRGDIRYFRSFQESTGGYFFSVEPGTLNFTRASVGAVFRF